MSKHVTIQGIAVGPFDHLAWAQPFVKHMAVTADAIVIDEDCLVSWLDCRQVFTRRVHDASWMCQLPEHGIVVKVGEQQYIYCSREQQLYHVEAEGKYWYIDNRFGGFIKPDYSCDESVFKVKGTILADDEADALYATMRWVSEKEDDGYLFASFNTESGERQIEYWSRTRRAWLACVMLQAV